MNGIDEAAFQQFAAKVQQDPENACAGFTVHTEWKGQTRTISTVKSFELLGETYDRHFTIEADEPPELLGGNTAPNPQELLMAALNACMSVGYAAVAATMGVTVRSLEIETTGELDLRGFLGLDANVNPGYNEIHYKVSIDADGTAEQIEGIHETVIRTSPNFANFSKAIQMIPELVVVNADPTR
ncbi:OsmC family protein [Mycobacteroides abscessus]|uniref:OsmC family peroxiredoxin n=1 Tax=Mycobacteroides abscessus TaxID=36809 RepID=A0ABD7HG90_9MYCO|nr:OsmC family protein [Mycobacteroides abscessus]RIR97225.1 OsmC family peroxiredoxin [Mycobacteroides abscessus]RIS77095.1 OsmC family peroxiredoxin [Mycobacteroides abscessus]RIT26258.1 OsmC family peroxiredoxin [Mycobacteroides abscessus]